MACWLSAPLPSGAGGEDGAYGSMRYGKHSNAYMLVYIRASEWPRIMCEVTKEDIVEHLRERLEVRAAPRTPPLARLPCASFEPPASVLSLPALPH